MLESSLVCCMPRREARHGHLVRFLETTTEL